MKKNVLLWTILIVTIAGCVTDATKVVVESEEYTLRVDYGRSIKDAIADGHYDWASQDIKAQYFDRVQSGSAQLEAALVHFNRYVNLESALAELEGKGLRAANLQELLAFGAAYPDIQKKVPVVALGAACKARGLGSDRWFTKTGYAFLDEESFLRAVDIYWGMTKTQISISQNASNDPIRSSGSPGTFSPDEFRTFYGLFIRKK